MMLFVSHKQRIAEANAKLADYREYFERAVLRCGFAAGPAALSQKQAVIDQTLQEFNRLEKKIESGDLDGAVDSARSLARMRGYLWPIEEAKQEAAAMLAGMEDWGVPQDVLNRWRPAVLRMETCPETDARAILYQLYADHAYWDDNVGALVDERKRTGRIAGGGVVVLAAAAILCFLKVQVLLGIVFGAASGATLSVLRKPPSVDVYKRVADFDVRVITRLVSGVMASLVTLGLIQTGVIVIPLPRGADLLSVLSTCDQGCRWAEALILFALALPLGFSERLLTAVGDALVPSQAKTKRARSGREDSTSLESD
jgi:hypothetical protein